MMKKLLLISVFTFLFIDGFSMNSKNVKESWRVGVAKVTITPENSMWLAGYGSRSEPSGGTLHELWAKALALEDASGNRAVLVTADILGWPKGISDEIRFRLSKKLNLSKAQILLNSSHTHTGPVLQNALVDIYPLSNEERRKIKNYSDKLIDEIVQLVEQAFSSLEVADVYVGNGVARFQVNRRNNNASALAGQSDLNGPNDYAVPVLKVVTPEGNLKAIAFGYACHPTVLSINKWSGDYPGFAQIELEKEHPGATAMFFQGAGADQNPLPRRTISLARQYGRMLAAAVDRVLEEKMQKLAPSLSTAYTEVELNLNTPPSKKDLIHYAESASGYQKRWAERMLERIEEGEKLQQTYPYPLQVWKLGDQLIFSLGGELLVSYSIQLKAIFGQDIIVMGYSNDVMSYIPTTKVLHEGGYEGLTAQMVYGLPATWSYDIETTIIYNMVNLAKSIGAKIPNRNILQH